MIEPKSKGITQQSVIAHMEETLIGLQEKLKAVFDEGPFGEDITITRQEAALAYRLLFKP